VAQTPAIQVTTPFSTALYFRYTSAAESTINLTINNFNILTLKNISIIIVVSVFAEKQKRNKNCYSPSAALYTRKQSSLVL